MTLRWLVLLFLALPLAPAAGQKPSAEPKPQPTISVEQARIALDMLNDPKKRAAFAATLDAIVKGQKPPEPAEPPPAEKETQTNVEGMIVPLAPDSLGAQVLLKASSFVTDTANDAVRAFHAVQSLPLLWSWAVVMVTNPIGQNLLIEGVRGLATALVLGFAIEFGARRLTRGLMAQVLALARRPEIRDAVEDPEARAEIGAIEPPAPLPPDAFSRRLSLGLARLAIQLIPVLALLVVGHAVAGSSLGGQTVTQLVILAVIDAIAACQALLALKTFLVMPDPPGLKLPPISDATCAYLMLWGRRLILIAVPGYAIGEVGLLLGMSNPAHGALQKAVGLALRICLGFMILQKRRQVRRWLSAPSGARGAVARLRNRLARYWSWMALFFLAASWLVWTLHAPDAIVRSLWYCLITAAVLIGASLVQMAASALLGQLKDVPDDAPDHAFRVRLSAYRPALHLLTRVIVNALALMGLLQIFGLGALTWLLTSEEGHRVMSGLGTLGITIGLAFLVWEGVNIAIQRHLEALRQEAQAARSARLRTLLPLVRTSLWITIVVVAGLMVLSEIGVNIAPLLAGAGIVGVAIGFGSQKLVQDVITGVFLLLENTVQVGDVVRVGDQTGFVESLSVRTIRLRTEDGSVVVIPFSAVTTVINMTRDFSRAVISIGVGTGEDVDHVVETMRQIVREMRAEEAWSAIILDDLEVWGLDKFMDSALQIKCRIMCTPFGRWPVGREFNRRMKRRFEELGIELPYPHLKLVFDGPGPPPGTSLTVS